MLILSKFKDYYDTAIGFGGIDKSLIYDRKCYIINDKPIIFSNWSTNPLCEERRYYNSWNQRQFHNKKNPWKYVPFIIGFCGKLYVGYYINWLNKQNDVGVNVITYDKNDVENFLVIHYDAERYHNKKERTKLWNITVANLYNKYDNKEDLSLFIKYNIPAFVIDFGTGIINPLNFDNSDNHPPYFVANPTLLDYDFTIKFDAFAAHQEIEMFLGGVLGRPEKEVSEVPDKYRLLQHGFDKWSFRKESAGK